MFLWWSSLHNTNVKGTNTFDTSRSLELDVDVSSWLKMKARHWWSLQVSPPYTMWGSFALYSSSYVRPVITHKLQACNPSGWLSWTCPRQPWSSTLDVILSWTLEISLSLDASPWESPNPQKHRQHIVWVSTQSAIDNFLSYHKILCGASFALVCWPFRVRSLSFILVNLYLYSIFNLDVLKGILNSSLE